MFRTSFPELHHLSSRFLNLEDISDVAFISLVSHILYVLFKHVLRMEGPLSYLIWTCMEHAATIYGNQLAYRIMSDTCYQ